MRPKSKHLESFREIMRTGSVTDAAHNLGLTQSAVSRQLAQLEDQLGLELFHRDKGRLTPLPEAVELCQEVDLALSSFDRIELLADDLRNLAKGQLRVVGPPSFVEGVLAGAIASFLKAYPDIKFTVDSRNHETIVERAVCRAVDCGFLKLPVSHPHLSVEHIVSAGTVCVFKKGHPLEKREFVTPHDLKDQPLILLGKGKAFQRQIEDAFRGARIWMNVKAETHAIGASCALAAQGVGVAFVNELMGRTYKGLGVSLVPFRPNIEHSYAFVTSSQIPMSRAATAFFSHCKAYFKSR
ncbi:MULTISPECIES: LysR family transcriptional regulator [Kordiimonas]|uniref:LysR family transcriptional regulator n=1 Tax=Kordiimonas TaxID=288021 RepID=UPI0025807907|nr:LysR family transcriptional regulator [Kordiimonas sp. UBA4487]